MVLLSTNPITTDRGGNNQILDDHQLPTYNECTPKDAVMISEAQVQKIVRKPGQTWDGLAVDLKESISHMKNGVEEIAADVEYGYCLLPGEDWDPNVDSKAAATRVVEDWRLYVRTGKSREIRAESELATLGGYALARPRPRHAT